MLNYFNLPTYYLNDIDPDYDGTIYQRLVLECTRDGFLDFYEADGSNTLFEVAKNGFESWYENRLDEQSEANYCESLYSQYLLICSSEEDGDGLRRYVGKVAI